MIILAWPPQQLSPNARCHWAAKSKAVKSYREAAGWATKAAKVKIEGEANVDVFIAFYPPSRRRHDLDNCLSSIKSGMDGVADALGVNDHRFRLHLEMCEAVKGGEVRIMVRA